MFYNDPFDDDDDGSQADFMHSLDYWARNKDRFFQDNPHYRPSGWVPETQRQQTKTLFQPYVPGEQALPPEEMVMRYRPGESHRPDIVPFAQDGGAQEIQTPEGPLTRGFDEWARQKHNETANASNSLEQGGYIPVPKDSGPRLSSIQGRHWESQQPPPAVPVAPPVGGPLVDSIADFTGAFMDGAFGPAWDHAMAGQRGRERRRIEDEQARRRSPEATEWGGQAGSAANVGGQAATIFGGLGLGYKMLRRFF
jgi:hypothetical protein